MTECYEELVVDVQMTRVAVIFNSNEDNIWQSMIWRFIREGTDGFSNLFF